MQFLPEFRFTGTAEEATEFCCSAGAKTGKSISIKAFKRGSRTRKCHSLVYYSLFAAVLHFLVSLFSSNALSLHRHRPHHFHQPPTTTPRSTRSVSLSPLFFLRAQSAGPAEHSFRKKSFSSNTKSPLFPHPKEGPQLPLDGTGFATAGIPAVEVSNENQSAGESDAGNCSTSKKDASSACRFPVVLESEQWPTPFRPRRSDSYFRGKFLKRASAFVSALPLTSAAFLGRIPSHSSFRMNGSVSPRLSMPKAHGETCSPGTRLHFSSCASELQRTAASRWFWKGHCTKKNCFSDSRCNETVSVAASCFRSTRAPSLLGNCGVSSSRRFAADPSWGLLSAAPMMDYTNRHWRHLISLMSRRVTLYTEMVSVPPAPCESSECSQDLPPSIKRKLWEEISSLSTVPNHVVLQVGVGSVASAIAVARAFNSHEFSENRGQCEQGTGTGRQRTFSVNLNCGCPSPRVAKGSFGLILMEDPKRVAEICQVLLDGANSRESQQGRNVADEATGMCAGGDTMNRMAKTDEVLRMDNSAVSVKCRVGIEEDRRFLRSGSNLFSATTFSSSSTCTYEKLASFIATVTEASPVRHFIIHARPGILVGKLSPKENLQIPQRRPEWVYRLCQDFPNVSFTFNGGVKSFHEAEGHLLNTNDKLGGVMVGRDILDRPWYWGSCADAFIAAQDERRSRQCTSSIEDGSEGNRAGPPQDQRRGSVAGRQTVEASVPGEDMKKNVSLKKGRQNEGVSRAEVVEQYACYVEEVEKTQGPGSTAHQQKVGSDRARKHTTDGGRIILSRRASLLKPLLNLFAGEPGSRAFKQRLQAACDSRNSHLAVESRSSVCTRPERERGETQAGEYTRQIVSTKASRIRFPRPEPTGEIIRRALEVFPSDVLEHRQSGET